MHPPTVAPATTAYEAVNPQGAVAARRGDPCGFSRCPRILSVVSQGEILILIFEIPS